MIERAIISALVALALLAMLPLVAAPLASTFSQVAHGMTGAQALTVKEDSHHD